MAGGSSAPRTDGLPSSRLCSHGTGGREDNLCREISELFEVQDLLIPRAITFEEGDNSGVEAHIALTDISYIDKTSITAKFSCFALPMLSAGSEQETELMASASVKIGLGSPSLETLASALPEDYNLYPVDTNRLYSTLTKLGYGYSGPFRTLSDMQRRH